MTNKSLPTVSYLKMKKAMRDVMFTAPKAAYLLEFFVIRKMILIAHPGGPGRAA